MFEQHIDWIARLPSSAWMKSASDRPRQSFTDHAAVTFDDGYRDVYEQAFPVLQRKGVPGAVFVVTDLVGQPFWQIHDRLYRFMAKAFASWDDPRRQLLGLLSDLGLPAASLEASRAATSNPMLTVSTLLPDLSRVEVSRMLTGLETTVGNGFGPAPQTLTWAMVAEMRKAGFVIGPHTKHGRSHRVADTSQRAGRSTQRPSRNGGTLLAFCISMREFTPLVVRWTRVLSFVYPACPQAIRGIHTSQYRLLLWERPY